MKANKKLIISITIVIVIIFSLSFFLYRFNEKSLENYSSTVKNTYRFGVKAFFSLLKKENFNVVSWKSQFSKQMDKGILFIIAPDRKRIANKEMIYLKKWIAKGNTLLFFSNTNNIYTRKNLVYESNILHFLNVKRQYQSGLKIKYYYKPTFENKFTKGIDKVVFNYMGNTNIRVMKDKNISLYAGNETSKIYYLEYKKGNIFFFPSVYPVCNQGIKDEDNLKMLMNIIYNVPHDHILFDEYHHHIFGGKYYLSLNERKYMGYAFLLILLAFILFLFKSYQRFGIIYPIKKKKTVSILEYTAALGNLYEFAKKDKSIIVEYYDLFIKKIAKKFGIKASGNKDNILGVLKLRRVYFYSELIKLDELYKKTLGNFNKKQMLLFIEELKNLEKKYNL